MQFLAEGPERLDRFLRAALPGRRRRDWEQAFVSGAIRVNGRRAAKGQMLAAGDTIELHELPPEASLLHPAPDPRVAWNVIAESDSWLALSKPPATPTHPLRPGELGTLANAVAAHRPACLGASPNALEAGAVHRLDTNTTGAILFAKDRDSWLALRRQFQEKAVRKTYLAIVHGLVDASLTIEWPIAHDPRDSRRALACLSARDALEQQARAATTTVSPLDRLQAELSLVRCETRTGRLHQVRVHLAAAGHPLWGDQLYGAPADDGATSGHFLHAETVHFADPATSEQIAVTAPLPAERAAQLEGVSS